MVAAIELVHARGSGLSIVVIDTLLGLTIGERWTTLQPHDRVAAATMRGYQLAQLLIGVLGALYLTGEYGRGMVRFGGFFGAQALLSGYHHSFTLSQSGALRVVARTGVYLTLIALLGLALGWILRSTAGAISTLV